MQKASAAGVPLRTAEWWLTAYLTRGAAGLRRSGRADKGRHRSPDELLKVIEGMALRRPPPHAAEVHRAAVKIAEERGWKAPSYTVVREVIAGLDRGLLALAHHDGPVYRDTYELVLRRESGHPNDLWQADHTELDVMVLDEADRPVRPWLAVIVDDHSRAVPGYTVFSG